VHLYARVLCIPGCTVADLEAGDAEQVARAAAEHHLEVMPLGAYHYGVGAWPR
jgi:hypothetical protein